MRIKENVIYSYAIDPETRIIHVGSRKPYETQGNKTVCGNAIEANWRTDDYSVFGAGEDCIDCDAYMTNDPDERFD